MLLLVASGSTLALAAGGASDPQPVTFVDQAELFAALQFDTGYLPSATDPIAIRLFVTPAGGVQTTLYGTSEITWPPLGHRVSSDPGGEAAMDVEIAVGAEVKLDLAGVFTGVVPLWTETVSFREATAFDGLLLPGHPVDEVELSASEPGLVPDLAYTLTVVPGVDLVASVSLTPVAAAVVHGTGVVTEIDDQVLVQASEAVWADVLPAADRPGELGVATRWTGEVDAALDLVIEPEIRVDTAIGQFTLARFPIPVDLVDAVSVRESAPVFAVHPLPVLATLPSEQAFGAVAVGDLAQREVTVDNLGELLLEAELRVEGDPAFAVWPPFLAATPDGPTGFVVTFAPSRPGTHEGSLVIETNDPTLPLVAIALTGTGGGDVPGDPGDGGSSTLQTCGCAAGAPSPGWLALAGLAAVALSRRRSPGAASRTSGSPPRR